MRTLFHYTCDHGHAALGTRNLVLPIATFDPEAAARGPESLQWLFRLSWFTDQARPDRRGLGLTSETMRCDRTVYRYRVLDDANAARWLDVWRDYGPGARLLNLAPGVRPGTWWVATEPVPVVLDTHSD